MQKEDEKGTIFVVNLSIETTGGTDYLCRESEHRDDHRQSSTDEESKVRR